MNHSAGTWLIYVLTMEGSYQQNLERSAINAPDTMQYWISDSIAWDIRTFAIDKDLRILQLDISNLNEDPIIYLDGIAKRTYQDIIKDSYKIDVSGSDTDKHLVGHVSKHGLYPSARWTELNFPLWFPERADYYSH